jgi:acetyl-CoA carboxylase, biotin carboxylase subunit
VYAEDPADQFMPSTGRLHRHRIPSGPGVRVDAGIEEGQEVPIHYDPMISKLCVHAPDRNQAISKMLRALREYEISGVRTTIPFCMFTLQHEDFRQGSYDTHFVKDHYRPEKSSLFNNINVAAVVSSILKMSENHSENHSEPSAANVKSNWWRKRRQQT